MTADLEAIGFNAWHREQADPARLSAGEIARVIAVYRESCVVSNGRVEVAAELTGKLMFTAESPLDYPAVGDWVGVQYFDAGASAIIDQLLPRMTTLKRKTPGKRIDYQLIAGNIDTGLIVQALDADFSLRRMERYLVMIHDSGIRPVVLLSKSDRLSSGKIAERKAAIRKLMPDVQVVAFSNRDDTGMDAIQTLLEPRQTFCMLGSSGVGKTSLLNNLLGREQYATRETREKDGKGRHTTTSRQLIRLPGGALMIDTPGMRELGNFSVDAGIEGAFGEIVSLAEQCRFSDCGHTQEQGCAILAALAAGTIDRERYESYMKLARESAFQEMSFLEKKQKDRQFGKMVRTVMKHKKRKR